MTNTELEQLVTDLESRVIALEDIIANLHLLHVTKIQWKELDALRQGDIDSIQDDIVRIKAQIKALENAG